MKTRIIEIEQCEDCPHFIYGTNECSEMADNNRRPMHIKNSYTIPKWCPLPVAKSSNQSNQSNKSEL